MVLVEPVGTAATPGLAALVGSSSETAVLAASVVPAVLVGPVSSALVGPAGIAVTQATAELAGRSSATAVTPELAGLVELVGLAMEAAVAWVATLATAGLAVALGC